MKTVYLPLAVLASAFLLSCEKVDAGSEVPADPEPQKSLFTMQDIARIFSELPLGQAQLDEVFGAVNSSSVNGYDEEYTMERIFTSPGSGVGSDTKSVLASNGQTKIRDLLEAYISSNYATKSGAEDIENYINELMESEYQIYWPYSEDWDGETYPVITFDPGYGAESNYGYEVSFGDNGVRVVDSILVDESVARTRPVWVINRNNDAGYSPMEMISLADSNRNVTASSSTGSRKLLLKNFTMLRNYDSWFAGASEFKLALGSMDGCYAYSESDLEKFRPSVTELTFIVKRRQLGQVIPMNMILLTDFNEQLDKIVMMITEDDGGTSTSWKCSATLKIKSKSYGFDIELPYKDKDDIVWRGSLSASYFIENPYAQGRFGDVKVTFSLE